MKVFTRWARSFALPALLVSVFIAGCGGGKKKVTVLRDDYNNPRILVENAGVETDSLLYEMQGYVEAGDRILQMDMLRRGSRGRLSEIFGEKALTKDKEIHAVGLPQSAKNSWEVLRKNHTRESAALTSFAKGVNRWLQENGDKPGYIVEIYRAFTKDRNFVLNDPKKFTPWDETDSIAIGESMSFYLSSDLEHKLMMGKIATMILGGGGIDEASINKFKDLFDPRAIENTFILGKVHTPTGAIPIPMKKGIAEGSSRAPFFFGAELDHHGYPFPGSIKKAPAGSNNWVVSKKAAGGKQAFLANDPHLPMTFPTTWYELALNDVRGVNFPGIPGIVIGHNSHIAWGVTNQPADVDDTYIEEMNPAGTHVKHNDEWKPIQLVKETVQVRRSDGSTSPYEIVLRWVPHHGPIISDHIDRLKDAISKVPKELMANPAISYRWVGHPGTTEMVAFQGINRAKNYDEFKASLKNIQAGAQNFVYADLKGNIGYYSHGFYPYRSYLQVGWPAGVPVLGTGEMDWDSDAKGNTKWRATVPELYNPENGFIVTANNDPYGHTISKTLFDYKDYFGQAYASGNRAKRISEMIEQKLGRIGLPEMQAIQYDHKDLLSTKFVAFMKDNVPATFSKSAAFTAARNDLLNWDGFSARDKTAPVVAEIWLREMVATHFKDVVSGSDDLLKSLTGATASAKTLYHMLNDSFASKEKAKMDKASAFLGNTLLRAAEKLPTRETRWGQYNFLKFYNPLRDFIPPIATPALERDGSWETVDVSGRDDVTGEHWGPSMRLIMTLEEGKPIQGVNVKPGGNYNSLETSAWTKELFMWRDGQWRDLVPFAK